MKDKPWSGRFKQDTDLRVERFSESVSLDKRLYREDIEGSVAHARMLCNTGIITEVEAEAIITGLNNIRKDIDEGVFSFDPALEDVHMNIEAELTRKIGEAGKKLHTARSRNDQVATDFKMYVRGCLKEVRRELKGIMETLIEQADRHVDTIVPGMTHLQHAQPVSFAHHLLAYYEMFLRDYSRIDDTLKRLNTSPLGSAALAGTPHLIDREMTSSALGFDEPCRNSMDAVSDRDFAIEAVFDASIIMMHLSRMAEEIIIWNSSPFSFVELSDAFTTGSSIMPQKKNPDVAELVRGKVGGVYGNLIALLTMMKSLPLAYNRDMQEDKHPVISSMDTVLACLEIMNGLIGALELNKESLDTSLNRGFITATDVADYLAEKGLAFRDAHRITGELVSWLIRQGRALSDLCLDEFRSFSDRFDEGILSVISPQRSVDRRMSFGGTARENVRKALADARERLAGLEKNI
ncbi:MAG TPA: argininosuccinate lyase [Deltaproteobacteria bacterium]|nr:argininosuccinate lyase [Deltaproteobacteria bacterium]